MNQTCPIRAAQAGDRQAFARLLEEQYDFIYRLAYKWCGHKADAEDVAQTACIKLAQNLSQYRFESAFRTWLYRLVINCAKDWQRSQRRHRHEALAEDEPPPGRAAQGRAAPGRAGQGGVDTELMLAGVLRFIHGLGEGFHEAVLLVLGEGMTHAEAAEVLQIKESTVSWRIHQVRARLQEWEQNHE